MERITKKYRSPIMALIIIGVAVGVFAANFEVKLPDKDATSAFQVQDSDSAVLMEVESDGDVGIGTTTPASKLEVNGTITTTAITASGTVTANGALAANGTVTIGDGGDTVAIDSSDWDISTTGDMAGIGAITADGTITANGDLDANGTTTIAGVTDASSAAAGDVGEVIACDATGVTTVSGAAHICSISLTAGDWDVFAVGHYNDTSGATFNNAMMGISVTSGGTNGTGGLDWIWLGGGNAKKVAGGTFYKRINISSTATYYLNFTQQAGTDGAFLDGAMTARRMR